jgi:hypothetical protein
MEQSKDIRIEKSKNRDEKRESGLVAERLTVEIPTEIQAGLRLPPCVYEA